MEIIGGSWTGGQISIRYRSRIRALIAYVTGALAKADRPNRDARGWRDKLSDAVNRTEVFGRFLNAECPRSWRNGGNAPPREKNDQDIERFGKVGCGGGI
jgi:hypothetical protein